MEPTCPQCGASVKRRRKFCSTTCANRFNGNGPRKIRAPYDARTRRKAREAAAPGLNQKQRTILNRKWIGQRRQCTYCSAPSTTVDHVVPLVRGGTNHEGNLTPCCRPCNGGKGGLTVIEWRTGRRLAPMLEDLPWTFPTPKPERKVIVRPRCKACGAEVGRGRRSYCSDECGYIAFKDYMRNRYRSQAGIPIDAPLYRRSAA